MPFHAYKQQKESTEYWLYRKKKTGMAIMW